MKISTLLLEGRTHYLVPMVMMVEGVHSGSNGPLFYPSDELARSVPRWNGKPIVIYHPEMSEGGGSAAQPSVYNRRKVGVVFNARMEGDRLLADAWLDILRLEQVDMRVLQALRENRVSEVSTGLYADHEEVEGTWMGEDYIAVARNHQPDHLAILPDQIGACSIADGAGLLRNRVHELDDEPLVMAEF